MTASAAQAMGILAALGGAGLAVLARSPRVRAFALALAIVASFAMIAGEVLDSPRFASIRHHPPLAILLAAGAVLVVGALALAFRRLPDAFAISALIALPLRVPIDVGGQTSSLLIPLYVVIAGGAAAYAWRVLGGGSAPPSEEPRRVVWVRRMLAAMLVLYALQSLYSLDVKNAVENTAFFFAPFAALFVLLLECDWRPQLLRRALIAVAAVAVVIGVIGIAEFIARHLILNTDLRAENALHIYYRVNSVFRDPNIFGRYTALAIVTLAGCLAWTERRRPAFAAATAAGVLLIGLSFSFSLTSFSALLGGLGVLIWARLGTRWAVAALVSAVLAGGVFIAAVGASGNEVSSGGAGRTSLISGGLHLARDRPLWGFGSGSFGEAFYTRIEQAKTTASHDTPIAIAAEQGLIGLAAYAGLIVTAAFALLSEGARGSPPRATVASLFVAMLVHTLGYASFLEDPATWAILAVGVALARSVRPPASATI